MKYLFGSPLSIALQNRGTGGSLNGRVNRCNDSSLSHLIFIELRQLWAEFDRATLDFDDELLLQVAGEMIDQMTDLFALKTHAMAQALRSGSHNEPIVPIDFFDRFVIQEVHIDLDRFIEPIGLLDLSHLDGLEHQREWMPSAHEDVIKTVEPEIESPIVKEVPVAVLVDWINLLQGLTADSTDAEESDSINAIQALSHEENIEGWSAQVSAYLESDSNQLPSFSALVEALNLSPSEVWLALLLGNDCYQLQRSNDDFYSEAGIEIVRQQNVDLR